tara:strand:+ start:278 stop:544 length:267 start_codon:yes stop_codon:yes gene_type:complete
MDQSLEELSNTITNLDKPHHIEILRMIKQDAQNIPISENTNGCFINMNELNDALLHKIRQYVDYNENQQIELDQHETIKNTIIEELIN